MCPGTGFKVSLPLQVAVNVMVSVVAQVLGNAKQFFSMCLFFFLLSFSGPPPSGIWKEKGALR